FSITNMSYIITEVYMTNGNYFNIIEVERERRSLSTLILSSSSKQNWSAIYNYILLNLVNASGNWTRKSLNCINTKGIKIEKTTHGSKGVQHRDEILLGKLL